MNPLVTICVPIYNAEPFLEKLFDSILNQTYQNIELILIDDLSTDDSVQIIRKYTERDHRIRLICRKKKGGTAAKAEEFALPFIRGSWYIYLSQDDFMDYDLIEKCVIRARETKAEIIVPNLVWYYEKEEMRRVTYPPQCRFDQIIEARSAFMLSLDWSLHGFVMVSMRVRRAINYHVSYYNDDEFYTRKSFLLCNKVAFVDSCFYYRQDNPSAITKSKHYFDVDMINVRIKLLDLLIECRYEKRVIRKEWKFCFRLLLRYIRQSDFWKWNMSQKKYIVKGVAAALGKLLARSRFVI